VTEGLIMEKAWLGVDAGKEFHWAHMLDASGQQLLSRKVENDEADISALISALIDEALSLAEEVLWALDQPGGSAALLLALLWERDQKVLYVPGLSVDRARDTYRGESKSDARDARVIADQARMRGDLGKLSRQVSKSSPSCSFSSLAAATSLPTRVEPSLASERPLSRCFPLWSERWI
jgi:transposase